MARNLPRRKRTKAQISFNMSRVKNKGSRMEQLMEAALRRVGLHPAKHPKMFGRPDFVFGPAMVAIFCDSHFWHGYNWRVKRKEIRSNRSFWIQKIVQNMRRDRVVTSYLRKQGWTVLRFWEHQILQFPDRCTARIREALKAQASKNQPCR
jgi:DNA mismatch endonuclease Vsr